jgi:ribonuclease D
VRSGKSHQADDWKRRPLPASQLAYAAADVEELPALHRALRERLAARGRDELVFDASREATWPVRDEPEPLSVEDFRNAWQLDVHSQAALCFLVSWHNASSARERAQAPDPKTLLAIASRLPENATELGRIKGVNRRFAAERGEQLVLGMWRATAGADASEFVPIDPPPYATRDDVRLDGWLSLARAEISADLEAHPSWRSPVGW